MRVRKARGAPRAYQEAKTPFLVHLMQRLADEQAS